MFVVWAIVADNPFGGEPVVAVPVDLSATALKKSAASAPPEAMPDAPTPGNDRAAMTPAPASHGAAVGTKTVTIIDGKTGARQEVVIPDGGNGASPPKSPAVDQAFLEMTPRGPIPKIAADGTRPAEAFAQPVKPLPGRPDAPRIALVIDGLGVSASATADAITKMPGAVTLAFMPYGSEVERFAARRTEGVTRSCCKCRWSPSTIPKTIPARRHC